MKTKHLFLLFFLGFFSVMLTVPQKQKRSSSKYKRSSTKRSSDGRSKRSSSGRSSGRGKKGSSGSRGGGGGSIITKNFTPTPPGNPIQKAPQTPPGNPIQKAPQTPPGSPIQKAPQTPLEPLTVDRIKKSTVVLSKEDLDTLKNTRALLRAKKETLKTDKDDLTEIKNQLEAKLKKEKNN